MSKLDWIAFWEKIYLRNVDVIHFTISSAYSCPNTISHFQKPNWENFNEDFISISNENFCLSKQVLSLLETGFKNVCQYFVHCTNLEHYFFTKWLWSDKKLRKFKSRTYAIMRTTTHVWINVCVSYLGFSVARCGALIANFKKSVT